MLAEPAKAAAARKTVRMPSVGANAQPAEASV